jgi:hypothetical protein
VHRVVSISSEDLFEVECVVAPPDGWCCIGDRELNLPCRYEHVLDVKMDTGPA